MQLEETDAEKYILELLKEKGKLRTSDIDEETKKRGLECPDETVRFLTKMKLKGLIKGKMSIEERTWVWWV
ncbi:MAG: hypothetical protein QXT63_08115 [Thermoplasmata archaeon]